MADKVQKRVFRIFLKPQILCKVELAHTRPSWSRLDFFNDCSVVCTNIPPIMNRYWFMLKNKKLSFLIPLPQSYKHIICIRKKIFLCTPLSTNILFKDFSLIIPPPNFLFILYCMHLNNTWIFVFYAQISIKIFNYMLYTHTLVGGYSMQRSFSLLWYI